MNVETAAVVLFSVLYLATLPAFFHWPMYWTTIVRILVLLGVLTMNETAVVPFTLLFLATLEAFFQWPHLRGLVYRILFAGALIIISFGCLCRIGEQLDIVILKRLQDGFQVVLSAILYCLPYPWYCLSDIV